MASADHPLYGLSTRALAVPTQEIIGDTAAASDARGDIPRMEVTVVPPHVKLPTATPTPQGPPDTEGELPAGLSAGGMLDIMSGQYRPPKATKPRAPRRALFR